jgi:hypothetical protein
MSKPLAPSHLSRRAVCHAAVVSFSLLAAARGIQEKTFCRSMLAKRLVL